MSQQVLLEAGLGPGGLDGRLLLNLDALFSTASPGRSCLLPSEQLCCMSGGGFGWDWLAAGHHPITLNIKLQCWFRVCVALAVLELTLKTG